MLLNEINQIPLFDSLVHLTANSKWFDTDLNAGFNHWHELHADLVKKAFLVGLPGTDSNEILALSKKNNCFIPIAPLELKYSKNISAFMKQIKKQGFVGIKIHPRLLKINLAHEYIVQAISAARDEGLIIFLCTIHRPPSPPLLRPVSDVLYDICQQTEGAKIILLHAGYYDVLATSELVRPFENVLLDLSTTLLRFQDTHLISTLSFLFKNFDRRICIGSDFPEYTMQEVLNCITNKILKFNDVPLDKLRNIFHDNLERLLCHPGS